MKSKLHLVYKMIFEIGHYGIVIWVLFLVGCSGGGQNRDPERGDPLAILGEIFITADKNPITFQFPNSNRGQVQPKPQEVTLTAHCRSESKNIFLPKDCKVTWSIAKHDLALLPSWKNSNPSETKTLSITLDPDEVFDELKLVYNGISSPIAYSVKFKAWTGPYCVIRVEGGPKNFSKRSITIFANFVILGTAVPFHHADRIPEGIILQANPPNVEWKTGFGFSPLSQKFWLSNFGSDVTTIEDISFTNNDAGLFSLDGLPDFPKQASSSLGFPFSVNFIQEPPSDSQWHEAQIVVTHSNGSDFLIPVRAKSGF